ncbi:polyprenyl synthetase family protein [Streptomyces sp. MBT33]|nr:polyprenyl synthetase family protein [Streptomyces sp. MBT33]
MTGTGMSPSTAQEHRPHGTRLHSAHPTGSDALRAVDADVPGAVRGMLAELLARRLTAAEAVDPLFARDLAARVARFTEDGGKFSRSRLVWWGMRACGGDQSVLRATLRIGAALELIQTCALVHDDVMDDAPVRRGRPSLHAEIADRYAGETSAPRAARLGHASAILAGDLALAWADDVVADTELSRATTREVRDLWRAMRMEMVAGQYLDVHGEATSARSLSRAIRAACLKSALYSVERPLALGAALAGATPTTTRALCSAGRCVGIAFQLRDDLLDVYGDPRDTGKPPGGDIRSGKPTYLTAVAQARAETAGDRHALAVLRDTLGRADLSDAELAAVREVFEATGARATVEAKIDRLVAQGLRHLDGALLAPHAGNRLRALLRSAAGTPPPETPDAAPDDVVPVSLSLTTTDEGARR